MISVEKCLSLKTPSSETGSTVKPEQFCLSFVSRINDAERKLYIAFFNSINSLRQVWWKHHEPGRQPDKETLNHVNILGVMFDGLGLFGWDTGCLAKIFKSIEATIEKDRVNSVQSKAELLALLDLLIPDGSHHKLKYYNFIDDFSTDRTIAQLRNDNKAMISKSKAEYEGVIKDISNDLKQQYDKRRPDKSLAFARISSNIENSRSWEEFERRVAINRQYFYKYSDVLDAMLNSAFNCNPQIVSSNQPGLTLDEVERIWKHLHETV